MNFIGTFLALALADTVIGILVSNRVYALSVNVLA